MRNLSASPDAVPVPRREHWEHIYQTKNANEVSWYKLNPKTSLDLILSLQPAPSAPIIDIGGGDSVLIDKLLELGFRDVSVLDISREAIGRAQSRLGERAKEVQWIVSDILDFNTDKRFDIWHDWAALHFLTRPEDIKKYARVAAHLVNPQGHMIMATFSTEGPTKCSGLDITQYSEASIQKVFEKDFRCIKSFKEDHVTPFQKKQNFLYALFQKRI